MIVEVMLSINETKTKLQRSDLSYGWDMNDIWNSPVDFWNFQNPATFSESGDLTFKLTECFFFSGI